MCNKTHKLTGHAKFITKTMWNELLWLKLFSGVTADLEEHKNNIRDSIKKASKGRIPSPNLTIFAQIQSQFQTIFVQKLFVYLFYYSDQNLAIKWFSKQINANVIKTAIFHILQFYHVFLYNSQI